MMRVGPLVLSLDGKLLRPRRMTKKINVHPEWKILQTLTNGAKRKMDHLLLHLVNGLLWKTNDESETPRSLDGKLLGPKRITKKINVHPEWKILQTLTNGAKRKLHHLLFHLKDDKEDECASRVEDSSNTNQWGKKEAGSSPPSSGKWDAAAMDCNIKTFYGLNKKVTSVKNFRKLTKLDMKLNDALPNIKVDPETYAVTTDGVHLTCAAATKVDHVDNMRDF
ncbi:urease isoform X1 [Tanacetum coccineum]